MKDLHGIQIEILNSCIKSIIEHGDGFIRINDLRCVDDLLISLYYDNYLTSYNKVLTFKDLYITPKGILGVRPDIENVLKKIDEYVIETEDHSLDNLSDKYLGCSDDDFKIAKYYIKESGKTAV